MTTIVNQSKPCELYSLLSAYLNTNITITEMSGGLFNRVYQVTDQNKIFYVKQFNESAKDPAFPPLPTTAFERFTVAHWVQHHFASQSNPSTVAVPHIIDIFRAIPCLLMESVDGRPLYDLIVDNRQFDKALQRVCQLMPWLHNMHQTHCPKKTIIAKASGAFKAYKAKLQYENLFPLIAPESKTPARQFLQAHLDQTTTVIHGDLNSKNILIDDDGSIAVIDFEQAQVADGVHDVAYLTSEIITAAIAYHQGIETSIHTIWQSYQGSLKDDIRWIDFRKHLAFQVLYRLKGPSRQTWTGHLTAKQAHNVEQWALAQIQQWLR